MDATAADTALLVVDVTDLLGQAVEGRPGVAGLLVLVVVALLAAGVRRTGSTAERV